jgi:hypothetical protein
VLNELAFTVVANNLKFSTNRFFAINEMYPYRESKQNSLLDYYFPMFLSHSELDDLLSVYFQRGVPVEKMMGTDNQRGMADGIEPQVQKPYKDSSAVKPSKEYFDIINDTLDYFEENKVNVVFVTYPQAISKTQSAYLIKD